MVSREDFHFSEEAYIDIRNWAGVTSALPDEYFVLSVGVDWATQTQFGQDVNWQKEGF